MNPGVAILLLTAGIARAQPGVPTFSADSIQPKLLLPGTYGAIYGDYLAPTGSCVGRAEPAYPTTLCSVQVLLNGFPIPLLYVSPGQLNFQIPADTRAKGPASLRVVSQGRRSETVSVTVDLPPTTLSLDHTAYADGPVWIQVQVAAGHEEVFYPTSTQPNDFGCDQVEVRRDGKLLPRIEVLPIGGMGSGIVCGHIGYAGTLEHASRLPLHLLYRFDQPGIYEVRFTRVSPLHRMGDMGDPPRFQSDWTPIEVLPAKAWDPPPKGDPRNVLSDYLPNILGVPDDAHLRLLEPYLFDPADAIRQYASAALSYWPKEIADRRLAELLHARGPSDVVVDRTFRTPGALDVFLANLESDDGVLLGGAIRGVRYLLSAEPPLLNGAARVRVEKALIAAADHVIATGDSQMGNYYACALSETRGLEARKLLWQFVQRGLYVGQSLVAIAWAKDPADLPRLAAILEAPAKGNTKDRTYASLPYQLRIEFGESGLAALESAMMKSEYDFVRLSCAEELIAAGRKSGFVFLARAIEENQFDRAGMVRYIQSRFPAMNGRSEQEVLAFLKSRQ